MAAEYRAAGPVEVSGRRLRGVVVRYGDVATTRAGRERFEAGAFGNVADLDTLLNLQHERSVPLARTGGGGLVIFDYGAALAFEANLPETRAADDALTLVRSGVLRGASMEFHALRERDEDGIRVVERAALPGLGIVDRPAFPASTVEARALLAAIPSETARRRRFYL